MFRDSRGVVHTVSSSDPLDDLPADAAEVLARTLLVPSEGDLGTLLERCEAVVDLLERWQDAFFAALPPEVDLEEEAQWAERAGLSLDDLDEGWEDEDDDEEEDGEDDWETPGQLPLEPIDLDEPELFATQWVPGLPEDTVDALESALMLLPMRTRLEALVAAASLVSQWTDLLADHEKCLGHLVLVHGIPAEAAAHEVLVDQHAVLHAGRADHVRTP